MARTQAPNSTPSVEVVELNDSSEDGTTSKESGASMDGKSSSKETASDKKTESGDSTSWDLGSDTESKSFSNSKPKKVKLKADFGVKPSLKPKKATLKADFGLKPKKATRKADFGLKPKKAKRKADSVGAGRKFNRRIWCEEDEIILLEGLLEYVNKISNRFNFDIDDFYAFSLNSFSFDASKGQIKDKMKRLKDKYKANRKKPMPEWQNHYAAYVHELKLYDLSQRIWDTRGVLDAGMKSKGVVEKTLNGNPKNKIHTAKNGSDGSSDRGSPDSGAGGRGSHVSGSHGGRGSGGSSSIVPAVASCWASLGFDEPDFKRTWDMMDESKRLYMKEKWNRLTLAQLKLSLQKAEFINQILNKNSLKVDTKKKGVSRVASYGSSSILPPVASYLASLGLYEHDSKRAWGLMHESKKLGIKEKFERLNDAQLELIRQKGEFINEIGKSMVEVLDR